MQYDYYGYRKEQLGDRFNELERTNDKNARKRVAEKLLTINDQDEQEVIESNLPYLWYEALEKPDYKNSIRDVWQKLTTDKNSKLAKQIKNLKEGQDKFQFLPEISDLEQLPQFSFMLKVPFVLKKPYLSKDDRVFHIIDNPVHKDKVFQTPMVAPSSWKGALRAAMGYQEDNEKIIQLFGNAHDDEKGQSGRLYFYPTFFDRIGLEVINPHDRKKGTSARGPIYLECVSENATGDFVVLYIPFGKVNETEVAQDLELVAKGVEAMLTVYGFGAKTSSGFGVVDINGKIEFAIRADWPELKPPEPEIKAPEPELPRYLIAPEKIDPDFLNTDGSFKSEAEYIQGKSAKKAKQLYDKARKWWDSEQIRLAEFVASEPILEPEPPSKLTKVHFDKLSELGDRTREIIQRLQNGGSDYA